MNFQKMKDLALAVFNSKKELVITAATLAVVVSVAGLLIYQGTKKSITLVADGEKRIVKTHAETVADLLEESEISLGKHDHLKPAKETVLTENMEVVWKPATKVTLTLDGEKKEYWTIADTVKGFLEEKSITINEHDKLNVALNTKIKEDLDIVLDVAFQVVVNDGGEEKKLWSTSTTVGDFLAQQGIELSELDRIEPAIDKMLDTNTKINIVRVEKVTDVVEEPIDYAVVTKNDNNLQSGKEKIVQEGKEGRVKKTYEVVLENGEEVSKTLVSEEVVEAAKDQIVAVGTKKVEPVSVSRGEASSKEFFVEATAYTANCNGCSGKTATGFDLRSNPNAKIIAVDPNVIPLGAKVWVEGYGYAIAADTGGNINGHKIDVFFPSKSEAYSWGRKKVKIKILK